MDGIDARRRSRHGASAGAVALLATILVACSAAPGASDATGPTPDSSAPGPGASASPVVTSAPSLAPRPVLPYPEVQSHGELTIAVTSPMLEPLVLPISCEWIDTGRVGWLTVLDQPVIAGEPVWIHLNLSDPGDPSPPTSIFEIAREGAAAYAMWPAGATGTVAYTERAPDGASGSIRFDGLRPEIESYGAGPLPSPIEPWIRPLGGDPAFATISGTAAWTCASAPATVPTPGPVVSEEPGPTIPPIPSLSLVSGEQRQAGITGCGGGFTIDGSSGIDSCGPSFQAPGTDRIVQLAAGAPLRFVLPDGWAFTEYSLGWVLQSEAERFRGDVPDTFSAQGGSDAVSGRVLELEAPPTGEWTVLLTWTAERGEDEMTSWPSYFRVVVTDD